MLAKVISWFHSTFNAPVGRTTNIQCTFDGHTITSTDRFTGTISLTIENIQEIGIETTNEGPFVEDVFWLLNKEMTGLRIPQESPVFGELMDVFRALENFDWDQFSNAMGCTNCDYFLCWKSPN